MTSNLERIRRVFSRKSPSGLINNENPANGKNTTPDSNECPSESSDPRLF